MAMVSFVGSRMVWGSRIFLGLMALLGGVFRAKFVVERAAGTSQNCGVLQFFGKRERKGMLRNISRGY